MRIRQGLAAKLHRLAEQLASCVPVEAEAPVVEDMVGGAVAAHGGIRDVA